MERGEYSNAVDIWSIGVIFIELLIGKLLFEGDNQSVIDQVSIHILLSLIVIIIINNIVVLVIMINNNNMHLRS